jgi:hypothetical protein
MPANSPSPHGFLILQNDRVVHVSAQAAELSECSVEALLSYRLEDLLGLFSVQDSQKILKLARWVENGGISEPRTGICIHGRRGKSSWIDLLLTRTLYIDQPALQMIWIDNSARLVAEEQLSENIWRVQILYDINQAIRTMQDIREIARIVLQHMSYLIPDYHSSYI